tara:strand:+ start:424 stop:897 length:474 start_codon:yes stop_codon:yes gene_type:complete
MNLQVDIKIEVEDKMAMNLVDMKLWLRRAFEASDYKNDAEVSVRVVDEVEIRRLNREFRHQDKITNILSFPAGFIEGFPNNCMMHLGDIIICSEILFREAIEQNKLISEHWAHILVHGMLHLLGFNHTNDAEAVTMENLEIEILTGYGLKNPYEESL